MDCFLLGLIITILVDQSVAAIPLSNLKAKGPDQVGANMTGVLTNAAVKVGYIIEPQQQLFQIEAMKMLNTITADNKLESKNVISFSV